MSATGRKPGSGDTAAVWVIVGLAAFAVGTLDAAAYLSRWWAGSDADLPANPMALALGLWSGDVDPGGSPGPALVVVLAVELLLAGLAAGWWRFRRRPRQQIDRAAPHMGTRADVAPLLREDGAPIGLLIPSRQQLRQGPEDVSVDIWGPRQGKTSRRTIPAVLAAPGGVLATSNRRDLLDATRDPRTGAGPVYVFDPQGIAGERPDAWWWNPLSYVTNEVQAGKLARLWTVAHREPGAKTDAYFEPAATNLLANLLLAAAIAARPITQVYLWLTDPTEEEPAELLAPRYPLQAAAVRGVTGAPEKQRGGVYGTALEVVSFLTSSRAQAWVTDTGRPRLHFDPAEFVSTPATLYALSKEGDGSTGPLVLALTVAVAEAAKRQADDSPGGRLDVPLTLVLDEAANICRWHELPALYSHFGGSGIPVHTYLQSWAQGVGVWGEQGMRALWSAATVRVIGSGVSEVGFLRDASELVGPYERRTASTSTGKTGRSRSWSTQNDRVLDVADLAGLPKGDKEGRGGRAVVFASGARRPALIETVPWWLTDRATEVQASFAAHDPAARQAVIA